MHRAEAPIIKDLVLVGGGHAHVAVLKNFGMHPMPGVRVTLISPDVATSYSGMLPGMIAGHYSIPEAHIDVHALCRFARAQFYQDRVVGVDLAKRQILCARRPPVAFDLLSLDIGSTPKTRSIPGADQYALPVKPVHRFLSEWKAVADRVRQEPRLRVAIAGGGAGGVELALSAQYRLAHEAGTEASLEFHVISAASTLLPSHNKRVQEKFARVLASRQVEVHLDHRVTRVTPKAIHCANNSQIPFDVLFWVVDASAPPWIRESGIDVDREGFVRVDATLRSLSHPFVFAAGDIAAVVPHPRPKAGVFAVRQGPPLTRNLRLALQGREPRPFRPQKEFLSLISTGNRCAIAARGRWASEGQWVWRWKDWIDRRWMRQYQELPAMPPAEIPWPTSRGADNHTLRTLKTDAMRCGGCGAKIGSHILRRVLSRLEPGRRDDVLIDLASPDDAAITRIPPGQLSVQSVDFFRTFINDPYRLGQVAANHCLSDLFAMGAESQSALALVTLPPAAQPKLEEQLFQVLSGAIEVLRAHRTVLAGGHTAEGNELAIGFAVHGLVDAERLLRKSGLQPGDALILTKPLGTGCLFAADMRHRARGEWIERALNSMIQSSQSAAACLLAHHASACTDVTGFGLIGHLLEMLQASQVSAELDLSAIPLLEGARECLDAGALSSLHPENLRLSDSIANRDQFSAHPCYPILFDPQTAGGLLAGVPAAHAPACLEKLRHLGYGAAAVIGQIIQPTAKQALVTLRNTDGDLLGN